MKVFCNQKSLEYALSIVDKAINPNNTLPVLNNILIKAEGKKLFFYSTNLEIAISCSIDADVRSEGSITVPAKLIAAYISLLNDENIELTLVNGLNLSVSSARSETKIKCISADEFPLIPKIENGNSFKIKTESLYKAISETVFAASNNNSRPVLSGVFFYSKGEDLFFVTTDSYRLAEKKIKITEVPKNDFYSIVPSRTMQELQKIIGKTGGKDVTVSVTDNQILFKFEQVELISRLIEGKFPDYEKIIPSENKTKIEFSVEDLTLVLKRVSLFTRENNNSVKISVSSEGKIFVNSDETKVGEEKAEIPIKIEGEDNKISLNSQYLLDVLNYLSTDRAFFIINDKASPAVIRPLSADDYIYIIMPLKV